MMPCSRITLLIQELMLKGTVVRLPDANPSPEYIFSVGRKDGSLKRFIPEDSKLVRGLAYLQDKGDDQTVTTFKTEVVFLHRPEGHVPSSIYPAKQRKYLSL